jgi:hypothetical protein
MRYLALSFEMLMLDVRDTVATFNQIRWCYGRFA